MFYLSEFMLKSPSVRKRRRENVLNIPFPQKNNILLHKRGNGPTLQCKSKSRLKQTY